MSSITYVYKSCIDVVRRGSLEWDTMLVSWKPIHKIHNNKMWYIHAQEVTFGDIRGANSSVRFLSGYREATSCLVSAGLGVTWVNTYVQGKSVRGKIASVSFFTDWASLTSNCCWKPVFPVWGSTVRSLLRARRKLAVGIWVSPQVMDSRIASQMKINWS